MKQLINDNWLFLNLQTNKSFYIDLPHDAMLYEDRDPNCVSGVNSGYFPGGKYVYSKEIELSKEDLNKDISIFFEGVYQKAKVYVNDEFVKYHAYGYTEFNVDIAKYVKEGKNTIKVEVDNSLEPNCRWYSGSGIYRDVYLIKQEKVRPSYLRIKTLSINPTTIKVESDADEIVILDKNKEIYRGFAGLIELKDVNLWSINDPYLYTCIARKGNEEIKERFGVRSVSVSSKTGFLLNSERILLRGGCIHSDNGVLGACSYKESEYRKVQILKDAGYNAIRCAHNPASRYFLDACDELGMLVLDESFDGWYIPKNYHDYARLFESNWKDDIQSMVDKDYNHPSVIMYSIGNEVSETASKKGEEVSKEMINYIKSLDDSRPVTAGINVLLNVYINLGFGVYKDKGEYKEELINKNKKYKEKKTGSAFFNMMQQRLGNLMFFMSKGKKGGKALRAADNFDVVGLNYAASRYLPDSKDYPDRVMLGTETMIHELPYNWNVVENVPAVIGDFCWAAWDYLGEAGVGDWMYHSYPGLPLLAGSGAIDITGFITAENYFQRAVWHLLDKPYIGVRPLNHMGETPNKSAWRFTNAIASWNYEGYENKKAIIEVYYDAYKVRLLLNDKVIGEKKIKDYKCKFKVKYQKGTLTAIALDNKGNEIARNSLVSGDECHLKIKVEDKITDNQIMYVPIEYVDENNNLIPCMEKELKVATEGCELLGFGSAIVKTNQSYVTGTFNTYRGRALAVIKVTSKKPIIKVKEKNNEYMFNLKEKRYV